MLFILINTIAPVAVCIAIGYGWGLSKKPYATEFITRLVTLVGAPCLVVSTIDAASLDWAEFATMAKLTLLLLFGFMVLGYSLLRLQRLDPSSFALVVMIPNMGNMGLSLCFFAFGQEGLALALIIFVVTSMFHFATGDVILTREGHLGRRLLTVVRQPMVYSAVISGVLVFNNWSLPTALANTLHLIGGITIPLMLITLGVSLSTLGASNWRGGLALAISRFVVGLGVSLALVFGLDIDGLPAKILILQACMPSAVFNYLFALKHDRHPATVASGVVISTFMSFITVPVLLWFLLLD